MRGLRLAVLGLVLLGFGLLLGGWALFEARRQRQATKAALTEAASLLAGALGPGLVAASAAASELDEIVSWKLLDNARLFAAVGISGPTTFQQLVRLAEDNGLDSVAFLDSKGVTEFGTGQELDAALVAEVEDVLSGRTEELILGSSLNPTDPHIAAAVARPGGGAVLVRIEASAARSFARRLGVENLLQSLAGTGGVLYLAYHEEPDGLITEASWDGGPAPAPGDSGEQLQRLRGSSAFEVEIALEPLPGQQATLRVGLDGAPLEQAAAVAMRRTLLIGVVLAAFAVAATAFAAVNRLRSREKEQATARLAEVEAARRRSERLAAAGTLTAGLAHEVRSPMNAIGLAAQQLQRKLGEQDERYQTARRIHREVGRLEGILREFLELASPVSDRQEPVDLGSAGREVCDLLAAEAEACDVILEPPAGAVSIQADAAAIRRALVNLVRNAIQASPPEGRVRLEIVASKRQVEVRVTDEGSGVDPQLEDRVFDAFVTGRASGTGLGLSLVRRVAEEHGGSAELVNLPQGGAQAQLVLPRS
jgi:signal transduction histidine kinase